MLLHQNSQKRYYNESSIYFITTDTYKRFPYFKEKIFCKLFIEDLRICKKLKKFKLYAFCLNYDHLHLLLKPGKGFNISKVMQSLKKDVSRDINYIIEGDIPECRLQGKQYSKRYNKTFIVPHLQQFHHQFLQKYGGNQIQIPKFGWQTSFRDHVIRGNRDLQNHYHYTVYNYTKHNLPDNWKYTSLNFEEMIDGLIS